MKSLDRAIQIIQLLAVLAIALADCQTLPHQSAALEVSQAAILKLADQNYRSIPWSTGEAVKLMKE